MQDYLTLEQVISLLLHQQGTTGMEDPRTIVAYAMDHMDPASPELRVLEQYLVVNNLRPESRKYRKIERSIAEGFVNPFARAAQHDIPVDKATSLALSYLRDDCMVRESVARQVVDGIARGITRWHSLEDEELGPIDATCRYCGRILPRYASFCSYCGRYVADGRSTLQEGSLTPEDEIESKLSKLKEKREKEDRNFRPMAMCYLPGPIDFHEGDSWDYEGNSW